MGLEIKRVPVGFDWPLHKIWRGYVNPNPGANKCPACDGSGYSPIASRYRDEWYGHAPFNPSMNGSKCFTGLEDEILSRARSNVAPAHGRTVAIEAIRLRTLFNSRWCHHLSQADVDALVAADRLWDFTRVPRTEEQRSKVEPGRYWMTEANGYTPTAREVNLWSLTSIGHDCINGYVCVKARCEREGQPDECGVCNGDGEVWPSEAVRATYEAWTREEPPAGDGWQIWETVSEGSPITPALATSEELADWCVKHKPRGEHTRDAWLKMISVGWTPSGIMVDGQMLDSVESAGAI